MKNRDKILEYAILYNRKEFIENDPIKFPYRYKDKRDIEISGFVSSWLAYGNRINILKTLERIHLEFHTSPLEFIQRRGFEKYKDSKGNLYRFYTYNDYYMLCQRFYDIYITEENQSLEDKVISVRENQEESLSLEKNIDNKSIKRLGLISSLIEIFSGIKGVPINNISSCKRLAMFLRWMVRRDGIVDLGIWDKVSPKDLILPLDTHSYRMSLELGLTNRKTNDMKTALEITGVLEEAFPEDPALGDFSLFGYGVNNK